MTWDAVAIDSVIAKLESGSRPKGGVTKDRGEIPSLGGENIVRSGGVVIDAVKRVPETFYRNMTKGHLEDGDVLINKDGANTGKVGWYRSHDGEPACINEHLFLLRAKPERVSQGYLYYSLLSEAGQRQIRKQISGSAQPGLKSGFVKGVSIDLPSDLAEQNKIVELLADLDTAIGHTQALISKQHRIKRGIMQDLLTRGIDDEGNLRSLETHEFKESELGLIPVEWEVAQLSDLTNVVVDGTHITPAYTSSGVRFVVVSDLTSGFGIDFAHTRFVSEAAHREYTKRVCPQPGDVLVSKDGTLGVARVVPVDAPDFSIFVSVALLRPRLDRCLPQLLWAFFESGEFYKQLAGLSAGTGLAHIHLEHFRKFLLRRPSVEEQSRLFAVISEQHRVLVEQYASLAKLWRLRTSLMQDLLSGCRSVSSLLHPQSGV